MPEDKQRIAYEEAERAIAALAIIGVNVAADDDDDGKDARGILAAAILRGAYRMASAERLKAHSNKCPQNACAREGPAKCPAGVCRNA